jgi:hypothetical protein
LDPLLQSAIGAANVKKLVFCWGQEECTDSGQKHPENADRESSLSPIRVPTSKTTNFPTNLLSRTDILERDTESIPVARARTAVQRG